MGPHLVKIQSAVIPVGGKALAASPGFPPNSFDRVSIVRQQSVSTFRKFEAQVSRETAVAAVLAFTVALVDSA